MRFPSDDDFRTRAALTAILLVAAFFRFFHLADNPPGLFRDEADKGYSTYSLLKTGRDLSGRFFPLQIKSFNAYTSPFYHWFSLPFVGLLGLNVWSIRLLAALAGTLACLAVFLFGRVAGGRLAGLAAALLLALSPWHVLFSRWANQGILMTLFIPLGAWLTWRLLEGGDLPGGKRWLLGILASLCWALGWNAYAPSRMFVSLFLLTVFGGAALRALIEKSETRKREAWVLFLVGLGTLVLVAPFLADILFHWDQTQTRLRFLAGEEPLTLSRVVKNYFLHWSPRYLLYAGDGNPRHHFFQLFQGQLCLFESASLLLGLFFLFRRGTHPRLRLWLLVWILLAPVPAALTNEGLPHALRTLMVVPALALMGGLGLAGLIRVCDRLPRGAVVLAGAFAVTCQATVTGHFLFREYPERSSQYWEAGFLEAVRTVEKNRQAGEICTVSGIVEFPQATVEFETLPDPRRIQAGEGVPGYRFLETGKGFDPTRDDLPGLLLLRSWETKKAPWWKTVSPAPADEAMSYYWRLYRTPGSSKSAETN